MSFPSALGSAAILISLSVGVPARGASLQDPPAGRSAGQSSAALPGEVVARVGDQVVTRGELATVVERMRAKGREREVLRLIVERKLLREKSRASGIEVRDEDVEMRVERTLTREATMRGMSLEQFKTQLRAQGWSPDDVRETERDRLLLGTLIRNRPDLLERTRVTPAEMRAYYATNKDSEFVQDYAIRLSGIKVYAPAGKDLDSARDKAAAVEVRLREGEKLEALVAEDDSLQVLDLGWVARKQKFAAPIMEFVLSEPAEKTVSKPLRIGTFWLVLQVRETREKKTHPFADRSVQTYIRSRLEEQKDASIRRRYIFEILDEFDIWPADLFAPEPRVGPGRGGGS